MANRQFNPLDIFRQLEQELRSSAVPHSAGFALFNPPIDMYETDDCLEVKMELAGVSSEKIAVTLSADDRILTIAGERTESKDAHSEKLRCFHLEIFYGAFEREVLLPGVMRFERDHIRASYRDGFLIVSLPKRVQAPTEKRTIPVSS